MALIIPLPTAAASRVQNPRIYGPHPRGMTSLARYRNAKRERLLAERMRQKEYEQQQAFSARLVEEAEGRLAYALSYQRAHARKGVDHA